MDYMLQANEWIRNIEAMTLEMEEKITQGDVNDLNELIKKRLYVLAKLVDVLEKPNVNKPKILEFLVSFQAKDRLIAEALNQEFLAVRNSLSNLRNMQKYF